MQSLRYPFFYLKINHFCCGFSVEVKKKLSRFNTFKLEKREYLYHCCSDKGQKGIAVHRSGHSFNGAWPQLKCFEMSHVMFVFSSGIFHDLIQSLNNIQYSILWLSDLGYLRNKKESHYHYIKDKFDIIWTVIRIHATNTITCVNKEHFHTVFGL